MKERVLITGATGFVGSHILEQMMNHPEIEVIAACRDHSKLLPAFKGEVREGDLRDQGYVETLLENIDTVCHAAAWTALWGHRQESETLYLQPSLNLIDQAIKKKIRRFINVSTTSANPGLSANPLSPGLQSAFWPHLANVVKIENTMKEHAHEGCQMVNLRLGLFAGERYGLGLLPILLPRLKTHLVPWVKSGNTAMPIIDGRDIGRAFALACLADIKPDFDAFNIVGPIIPSTREVIEFIHQHFPYPQPHFSVPFYIAYRFAWLMEKLDAIVSWEPLVTRSIIHLLEDTHADNHKAFRQLGYQAEIHWQDAIKKQIDCLHEKNLPPMKMAKEIL